MAKWQNDDMLDAALNYILNNCNVMVLCSQQPATYTEAYTTYMLVSVSMDSGDFSIGDGPSGGRRLTISGQNSVSITNSGNGTHVGLLKTSTTTLLYVTVCATLAVVALETTNFPVWYITFGDAQ